MNLYEYKILLVTECIQHYSATVLGFYDGPFIPELNIWLTNSKIKSAQQHHRTLPCWIQVIALLHWLLITLCGLSYQRSNKEELYVTGQRLAG